MNSRKKKRKTKRRSKDRKSTEDDTSVESIISERVSSGSSESEDSDSGEINTSKLPNTIDKDSSYNKEIPEASMAFKNSQPFIPTSDEGGILMENLKDLIGI